MRRFFVLPQETETPSLSSIQQWRESFLHGILVGAVILGVFALLPLFFMSTDPVLMAVYIAAYLMLLAVTFLRVPYSLRAGAFLFLVYIVGLNNLVGLGVGTGSARLFLLSLIIFSGLLLSPRAALYTFGLSLASMLVVGWLTLTGLLPSPASESLAIWLTSAATFLLLAGVTMIGMNSFHAEFNRAEESGQAAIHRLENERAQLEEKVLLRTQELEEKTAHLRASTSIARASVQLEDTSELMNTVVALTEERFSLSHVGIFLLDERKKIAFLQAASSQAGKDLIARGYRVEIERRSAISSAVEQGRYLTLDYGESKIVMDADFPGTRARLILPLNARGAVIGVMDLHSEKSQVFGPEDAEILQSLADLVAIAIENVRLLNETRALVTQLESLTSYQSQEAWRKFSSRRAPSYQYTPAGIRPVYSPLSKQADSGLQIPISLRGQKIGAITLRRKDNTSIWTERERDLLEKIGAQVALALDNSRLVEEAQKNAQRDQVIASISNRVRETLDIEAVVRTAATELRRIFDLKEAEVSLGAFTPPSVSTNPTDGKPSRRTKSS